MTVVEFASIDDFIAELRDECSLIADRIVRWHISRTPEQREGVSFQIDVWATALRKGGDEDLLLEFGQPVGSDSQHGQPGTQGANAIRSRLAEACDDLGLKIRPGKIEVY
jgi:hypothetical protein